MVYDSGLVAAVMVTGEDTAAAKDTVPSDRETPEPATTMTEKSTVAGEASSIVTGVAASLYTLSCAEMTTGAATATEKTVEAANFAASGPDGVSAMSIGPDTAVTWTDAVVLPGVNETDVTPSVALPAVTASAMSTVAGAAMVSSAVNGIPPLCSVAGNHCHR